MTRENLVFLDTINEGYVMCDQLGVSVVGSTIYDNSKDKVCASSTRSLHQFIERSLV